MVYESGNRTSDELAVVADAIRAHFGDGAVDTAAGTATCEADVEPGD